MVSAVSQGNSNKLMISIIVPVFNKEEYLASCIESLLRQGLSDDSYEIILVNDGSTDGSLAICNHYSELYAHICVISKENQGPGPARNMGILHAQGDFVCFVDADDYLEDNGLSEIRCYINNEIDAIRYLCRIVYPRSCYSEDSDVKRALYSGTGHQFLINYGIDPYCWNWIYRRSYLIDKNLSFQAVIGEDFLFIADVLLSNPNIVAVTNRIYNYVIRESSISSTRTAENSRRWVNDLIRTLPTTVEQLSAYKTRNQDLYDSGMSAIEDKKIILFSRLLSADYSLSEYKETIKRCKALRLLPLERYSGSLKQRWARMYFNLLYRIPLAYMLTKRLYNKLFLPFIKPLLDRNT